MAGLALVSIRERLWIPTVAAVTALRFAATSIYEMSGASAWAIVAGILGLALFLVALAAGLAVEIGNRR